MGEDAARGRSGSGPQVRAASRNLAVSHPRHGGVTDAAAGLRRDAARVRDLLVSSCILKNWSTLPRPGTGLWAGAHRR